MDNLITDFTLKSSVRRIVNDTYSKHMEEPAADYHNLVISQLWSCISTPQVKNQTADTDTLIGLIRMEYGNDSVKDSGLIDGYQKYEIGLSNVRFHIVKLPHSYLVSAALPEKKIRYISCLLPKDMIAYMSAFNSVIPEIIKHIEQNVSEKSRDQLLCKMNAATGKGIVDQLITEEKLDLPKISSICGTANGRVKLYFADSSEKINCPLNHLRARLLRRFKG